MVEEALYTNYLGRDASISLGKKYINFMLYGSISRTLNGKTDKILFTNIT